MMHLCITQSTYWTPLPWRGIKWAFEDQASGKVYENRGRRSRRVARGGTWRNVPPVRSLRKNFACMFFSFNLMQDQRSLRLKKKNIDDRNKWRRKFRVTA